MDGEELVKFYNKYRVEISDGTPIHIRLLQEVMGKDFLCFTINHFIIGGEALPRKIVEGFFHTFEDEEAAVPKITNVYGPTECSVDSTFYEITSENLAQHDAIPIGSPMPNYRVYILDSSDNLQPVGVAGEIFIGGVGVGRGYFKRETLTSERFVTDPFSSGEEAGESRNRMYRSGDLGKWLPDGNIEFLGRIDH
jgi:fengycin family lipopeptide synthetase D